VGQGDGILISKGWFQTLIDVGEHENINQCLLKNLPKFDKKIELMFLTHPDSDHIGGLNYFFNTFQVENLIVSQYLFEDKKFSSIRERFSGKFKKIKIIDANKVEKLVLDDFIEFHIVSSNKDFLKRFFVLDKDLNCNNHSLVMYVVLDGIKIFLGGDIEKEIEELLLDLELVEKVDILKVNHHGSKTSSTNEFIDNLKPELSVFQVGLNNKFGHPDENVYSRIMMYSNSVYRNDRDGEIGFFIKDGNLFKN
jgi:competence protein ComEC